MNNNEIILSVIVPCYNCQNFIDRCVKSIKNNTIKETEILLINDGSTDNTLDTINRIARENSNVIVFDKINTGVSDTRNFGIAKAKGKYISFVDSDDYIRNNMFTIMVDKMEKEALDIICCDYVELHNDVIVNSKFNYEENLYNRKEILEMYLIGKISISIWDKMFRKDIIKNIQFNCKLAVGEDSLFCLESFMNANRTYLLNDSYYVYFQNEKSAVHTVSNKILQIAQLDKYIPTTIKQEFNEHYKYFMADCMLRCIHTLSIICCKDNKKSIIKFLNKICDKNKINILIKSKYSTLYVKIEMIFLKAFGIRTHLFLFKYYKKIKTVVRK